MLKTSEKTNIPQEIRSFGDKMMSGIMDNMPGEFSKGLSLELVSQVKVNDQFSYGISFRRSDDEAVPVFPINDLYYRSLDGEDLGLLCDELARNYAYSRFIMEGGKKDLVHDLRFANIRNDLALRLLEKERNRLFLESHLYFDAGCGFALCADIVTSDRHGGQNRATVTKEMLKDIGVTEDELFKEALRNAPFIDPPLMRPVIHFIDENGGPNVLESGMGEVPREQLFAVTTKNCIYGASALFYPGVMKRIREVLEDDYYMIPSSFNEVLILPDSCGTGADRLYEVLAGSNDTIMEESEILSYRIFHYSEAEKALREAVPVLREHSKLN